MNNHLEKAIWKSIWRLIGLIVFFIVILILNTLRNIISLESYNEVIMFINSNLFIFVAIILFHFIAEMLANYKNGILSPPFEAIAGIFVASIIIKVLAFIGYMSEMELFYYLQKFDILIYVAVFFVILIGEYLKHIPHKST